MLVTLDASLTGWGAFCDSLPACGDWRSKHQSWHINCLELLAVLLALSRFLQMLQCYHVFVRTDNMMFVHHIIVWFPGVTNMTVDFVLRHSPESREVAFSDSKS